MLARDKPLPCPGVFSSHSMQSLAKKSPVAAAHGLLQQGHLGSVDMVSLLLLLCFSV
jgi:hypothetical protein